MAASSLPSNLGENRVVATDFLGRGISESGADIDSLPTTGASFRDYQRSVQALPVMDSSCGGIHNTKFPRLLSLHEGLDQFQNQKVQKLNNLQRTGYYSQGNWSVDPLKGISSQRHEGGSRSPYFSNGCVEAAKPVPFNVSNSIEGCTSSSLKNQQMTTVSPWLPRPVGQHLLPVSDLPCHMSYQTGVQTRVSQLDLSKNERSAQLTIFYDGSVNVYENVSTVQAQAIMLMASASVAKSTSCDAAVVHSRPTSPQHDACGKPQNQVNMNFQHLEDQVVNRSPEFLVANPFSAPQSLVPRALPQARKASLARFLEKRKERVLSKYPFSAQKTGEGTSINHLPSSDKCAAKVLMPADESPDLMSICDSLSATGS